MKVLFRTLLGLTIFFVVVFVMGPTVDAPIIEKPLPELSIEINALPQWVKNQNDAIPNIKPGNESEVIFADSIPQKTKYAIVYLHGFSGSTSDGGPVHKEVAAALGANIYLPRLYDHGLDTQEGLGELYRREIHGFSKRSFGRRPTTGRKSDSNGNLYWLHPCTRFSGTTSRVSCTRTLCA